EPMLNKAGRTRFILCGPEGRIPFSAKLSEQDEQSQSAQAIAMFKRLRRSDAIQIKAPDQRETGYAVGPHTLIILLDS
ncbi:MAG: hypothetical protein SNJ56_01515, partial [Termitinemataceae bacterium]